MPEAEGERGAVRGGRRSVEGAASTRGGRAVPLGPPKFINRRHLSGLPSPPRVRMLAASRLCGVAFLRAARANRMTIVADRARPSILTDTPAVRLDFYIEALFQKLRPLALGLRSRAQERVVNVANAG